jgi:acyl-CoA reductase-like NAD-dependent aldehyde dehydrogenase
MTTNSNPLINSCHSVASTSESEARRAIELANSSFTSGVWSRASAIQRSLVLTRLARSLEEHIPEFAELESLQTGRTIREMRAQLTRLPEWL